MTAGWRDLALVMTTSTVVGATLSLSFPLLSLVLEREGHSAFMIGLNAVGGSLAVLLVAPFAAPLIARIGAVRAMQIGIVVPAAVLLVLPLWIDIWVWFGLRFILGAGAALMFVVSEAAVNALADEHRRGRIIGIYGALFCVGYAAGPAIIALVGSQGVRPFVIAALLLLTALLPASLAHAAESALSQGGGGHQRPRLVTMWRLAPLALGAVLVFGIVESSLFALMPIYGLREGLDEPAAALLLTTWIAGNIVLQYPLGWLADRISRERVLLGAVALSLVTVLLMHWAIGVPGLIWPLLLVQGGMLGGLYTLSLILVGQQFRGADLAVANTAFVMTLELGVTIGPVVGGLGMTTMGTIGLPMTVAAVLALFLAARMLIARPRAVA